MNKKYLFHLLLLCVFLLAACKETNTGVEEEFDRHIALSEQSNIRDLGSYVTNDKQEIKRALLYRSGTLSACSLSDVAVLDSLGIKTVVNFLTEEERQSRGEDNLPEGTNSIFLPISGDNQEASSVLNARQTGDFSDVPIELNHNIHALLVEVGKDAYKGLFEVLADAKNYPILFHCSHGVHRTGTATALILMTLDVPWNTIVSDYMLSNSYRLEESNARIQALSAIAEKNPDVTDKAKNLKNIEAFYLLDKSYIEGTKEAIENDYGNILNYLESIGVDSVTLERVKANLLSN